MANSDEELHVTQYRRPWWRGVGQHWPLLVFVSVLLLAVFLYSKGGKYRVMTGTAERIVETGELAEKMIAGKPAERLHVRSSQFIQNLDGLLFGENPRGFGTKID